MSVSPNRRSQEYWDNQWIKWRGCTKPELLRTIVELRHGGMTYREIGERLLYSIERVRQLYKEATSTSQAESVACHEDTPR